MDSGLAISTILIFFVLLLPQINPPNWWGNNVVSSTLVSSDSRVLRWFELTDTLGLSRYCGAEDRCYDFWTYFLVTYRLTVRP
jgi:hypothetical protein